MRITWKKHIPDDDSSHLVLFAETGMSMYSLHVGRRGLNLTAAATLADEVNHDGKVETSAERRFSIVPQGVVRSPARHTPEPILRRLFSQIIALATKPRRIIVDFASPVLSPRLRTALATVLGEFESHPTLASTEVHVVIGDGVWPELKVEHRFDDLFTFAPANADALVAWDSDASRALDVNWRRFMHLQPEDSPLRAQGDPLRRREIVGRSISLSPKIGRLRAIWICPNEDGLVQLPLQETEACYRSALDELGEDEDVDTVAMMLIPPPDGDNESRVTFSAGVLQDWYYEHPSTSLRKAILVSRSGSSDGHRSSGNSL